MSLWDCFIAKAGGEDQLITIFSAVKWAKQTIMHSPINRKQLQAPLNHHCGLWDAGELCYQPAEMDESDIFKFGCVGDTGANTEETEAAMTPPGELVLALGVDGSTATRGRLKSQPLLRNSGQKCRRWRRHGDFVHFVL